MTNKIVPELSKDLIRDLMPSDDWRCLILLYPGEQVGLLGRFGSDVAYGWRGKIWIAVLEEGEGQSEAAKQTLRDAEAEFESIDEPVEKLIHINYKKGEGRNALGSLVNAAKIDLVLIRIVSQATELVTQLDCDVGVFRGSAENLDGSMKDLEINRMLLPSAGGPNTMSALQLLRPIARQCEISVLYIVGEVLGENGVARGRQALADILNLADVEDLVQPIVNRSASPITGITKQAKENYDLVLIGASEDALSRVVYGDVAESVVRDCQKPIVVMKRAKKRSLSTIEQINWQIRRIMPNINRQSRSDTYKRIKQNSQPDVSFYVLITLSAAIAGAGLLLNSPAVVIGAMLVAPLMSPIVGVGMSMVLGETTFLRDATSAVIRGAVLAIGVGMLIGLARVGADQLPAEVLARTAPSMLDLVVALFSGFAGAYALCYSQAAGALPGVSIAAALVPPLAVVGICLTTQNFLLAGGALLLFGTNLVTIASASGLVFFLLGFRPMTGVKANQEFRGRAARIAGLLLLINVMLLGAVTYFLTSQSAQDAAVANAVEFSITTVTEGRAELDEIRELTEAPANEGGGLKIAAVVNAFADVTHDEVEAIRTSVQNILDQQGYEFSDIALRLQIVDFEVIDPAVPPVPASQPVFQLATVSADDAQLMEEPGTRSKSITNLPQNSPVMMLDGLTEVEGVWWQKVTSGQDAGWVPLHYLSLSE